ncbi:MAG: hypothetical protein ACOYKD_09410 [Anaerolineaceae bacterium]
MKDRVNSVWAQLPKIIPLVENAYYNQKDSFEVDELHSLKAILVDYDHIINWIRLELMCQSGINFSGNDHEMKSLIDWLPVRLISELPEGILMNIAMDSYQDSLTRIAKCIATEGMHTLEWLGIQISDDLIYKQDDDTVLQPEDSNNCSSSFYSTVITNAICEIDKEIISLGKLVRKEPGFGSFYKHFERQIKKYSKEV